MKKYFKNILFALLTATVLAGCAPTPPEEVAVNLFNALTSGDMQYVKKNLYFSDPVSHDAVTDFLDMIVQSSDYKKGVAGYKADYYATKVVYEGDVVWVELSGTAPDGSNLSTVARLLFVDGEWLVDADYCILHSLDI